MQNRLMLSCALLTCALPLQLAQASDPQHGQVSAVAPSGDVSRTNSSFDYSNPGALSVQRFTPQPGAYNYNQVLGARVPGHLNFSAGLFLNYGYRPLVARPTAETELELLRHDLETDLLLSIGLGSRVELGAVLPFTAYQAPGEPVNGYTPASLPAQTLGDIRLVPKIHLLGPEASGLALVVPISLPTGNPEGLHGEAGASFHPQAILEPIAAERFKLALNLGYLIRPSQTYLDLVTGNELSYALGMNVGVIPSTFHLVAEAFGRAPLGPGGSLESTTLPLEANLAARIGLGPHQTLTLGGGAGISIGYGSPSFRGFVAYAFSSGGFGPLDKDRDGIPDTRDTCPADAEDIDMVQDEDGCPDVDNDNDGIPDSADRCPNEPEDPDHFQDQDGCPDPDNDKDGVPDSSDRCPDESEDRDGFQDGDGCIDADNDNDKLPDASDQCPNKAEDMDGFGDEDGCPEIDFDKDGVRDEADKCPRQPETINGFKDEDGCADPGPVKVSVGADELSLTEPITFEPGKAVVSKKSLTLMPLIAATLRAYPELTRIRIEVTVVGSRDSDITLARNQAEAVRQALVGAGVEENRLEAREGAPGDGQPQSRLLILSRETPRR